jgi:glutathione S-transferase
MELYFSPLACSVATRIALYEAGVDARFVEVDPKTHTLLEDGSPFSRVTPLALVPALRTDDGEVLVENAAPTDVRGRERLQQWLCFIGTELHKLVFAPLLDASAPAGAREYALSKVAVRFDLLSRHLEGRDFLLERFSVADAYLVTVLSWAVATPIELGSWPVLAAYVARLRKRPSVAKALAIELPLYQAELARHAA